MTLRLPWGGASAGAGILCGGLVFLLLFGCSSLGCRQTAIIVAKKEERARLETVPYGYTAETGRLEEQRRAQPIRD